MTDFKIGKISFGPAFKDFDRYFVGFEEQLSHMQKLHADVTKNIPGYPPYNIKKTGENSYSIELAVAGFAQSEIDIEIDDGKLIVKGNVTSKDDDKEENYLFKGIANRGFTRAFAIADQFEVKDAELFNGMLKIILDRLVPEEKKPKKVPVKAKGSKQYLAEGELDE
jgi:molecular chaperone IbpA